MAQTMAEYLVEQGFKQGFKQGFEQGFKQGFEQGFKQGFKQGIEQSETRAKREAVLKLLQFRFDAVPESVTNQITRIRSHSHLDSLVENVMTAQTLDEIDWQNRDG